jgi:ATP-dependent RNA helicase RhlE
MLNANKVHADAIHGNKSQNQRTKALQDFKSGFLSVLVATDLAARGIDVDEITHVINYDIPHEHEVYVHRIGRTARAGAEGIAYSFCAAEDRDDHRAIEKLTGVKMNIRKHPNHSNAAQFAEGAAAKPAPRAQGRGRSGDSRGPGQKGGHSGGSGKPGPRSGQSGNSDKPGSSGNSGSRGNPSGGSGSKGTFRKSHSKSSPSGGSSSYKKGNQRSRN